MTHALSDRAMVVNLTIGVWQGYRLDKAASASITQENGAASDAARVNKHIIPKTALAPIVKALGALRVHFYSKTLPWRDNGDRLLTRKLYFDFIKEHERLVSEFQAEVEKFLTVGYLSAVEQAGFRMGTLFNPDDYPSARQLRHKFYARLEIDAVTTANDFRVQIDQEHVDRVRSSMERAAEQRINAAMGDVWKRIADTVGYFAERMGDPDAVFRDSTVKNIAELIDLIPGLNVLDDPDIERIRADVKSKLGGIEAKDIRKDPELRAELADEAQQIMDTMAGFLRAFGAEQKEAA